MAEFYVIEDGYLVSMGMCPDGMEERHAKANQKAVIGKPPGFNQQATPFPGARWHIARQAWMDARTAAQKEHSMATAYIADRRAAYPPLNELADAMFWQSQGDNTKMEQYNAKVAAVKAQFPKSN